MASEMELIDMETDLIVPEVPIGTIVTHVCEQNGRLIEIEYRRDEGCGFRSYFWSYRPKGRDEWVFVKAGPIRMRLDRGLHPRSEDMNNG